MKTLQKALRSKKKQHPLNKMFFDKLQEQVKKSSGFKEILSYEQFKQLVDIQTTLNSKED